MYDLVLYDTSNFEDFPIGGQLTSIRNFLKYIAGFRTAFAKRMLLVGVTTRPDQVGEKQMVEIDGVSFDFLPVLYRNSDLSSVQKSLRVEYLRALIKFSGKLGSHKGTIHYIHTPEAYIAVKMARFTAKTVIFSHGSFFNMTGGFRFFQKNKLVHILFNQFIILLLKTADLILVLDQISEDQYRRYTSKVYRAENSIVVPQEVKLRTKCEDPVRLIYVGRLSKVKQVDKIIESVEMLGGSAYLTIVGDGEERQALQKLIDDKKIQNRVKIIGSVAPQDVEYYFRNSDILVMNSVFEGKPMTILEAMSYGLPVITTAVGGIPEMVNEGSCAEFTNGMPDDIASKVGRITSNYASFTKNARKKALKYDFVAVNEQLCNVMLRTFETA